MFTDRGRRFKIQLFTWMTSLLFLSCGGEDRQKEPSAALSDYQNFSIDQQLEDFNWITGHIEEYYGMLEYKEKRFGFNWQEHKKNIRQKILSSAYDRDQFMMEMQKLIAFLRDGHASALFFRNVLDKGYQMHVSTLGFLTERYEVGSKSFAVISKVYSNVWGNNKQPIKVGDVLLSIDGKPVSAIIQQDILPYVNLGNPDSNITYAISRLTNRVELHFAQTPQHLASVQIKRGDKVIDLKLQWINTTLGKLASKKQKARQGELPANLEFIGKNSDGTFLVKAPDEPSFSHKNLPAFWDFNSGEVDTIAYQQDAAVSEMLGVRRGQDYPNTFQNITVDQLDFRLISTAKGLAAVYRVDDFTRSRIVCKWIANRAGYKVGVCRDLKGEDYSRAFARLSTLGIKHLILDLRSNGGGFLSFGYEMLRAFSTNSLRINETRVRLNEEWVGKFNALAHNQNLPLTTQHGFQQQLDILKEDVNREQRMSSPISIFGEKYVTGTRNAWQGQTYVLVDEMCASMCDIFATLMQDHKKAKIIGQRSMGAGGNVIGFKWSPHTKIGVSLTASIMYRLDNKIIENEGATPDYPLNVRKGKTYWNKVVEILNREPE